MSHSIVSAVILNETSNGLASTILPLLQPDFVVQSASFIQEWSTAEKIVGIGAAMYIADSSYQLYLFEIENYQIEWIAVDSSQQSNFLEATRYCMFNNRIHLIYSEYILAQTAYQRHYYKISKNGKLKFKSIIGDGNYIAGLTKLENDQILISGIDDEIFVIDTLNSPQISFYSYERQSSTDPLVFFRLPEKIQYTNGNLIFGAYCVIDREPEFPQNQNSDAQGLLMKINLIDSTYQYRSFGGVDTVDNDVLYSRDDCRLRSFDFHTDASIFQVTTLNSYASIWFQESSNSLLLTHLDTNLNTIWQTEYTPEDSMRILCLDVKAQPDGGVVLINQVRNWKYKPENGYDLQFLRFNHRGELMGETILPNQSSDLGIYPNPSNGIFTLESSQSIQQIEVFDLQGRKVFEAKNQTQINLSALQNNTYLARILLDNGLVETKKLVLMK